MGISPIFLLIPMSKSIFLCKFYVTLHDYRFEFCIRKHMAEKNSGFGVKHMNLNPKLYNVLI